jgi:hypothetical protein
MAKKAQTPMKDLPAENAEAVKGGALDGISRLVAVTQMKADTANNKAATPFGK